MKRTTGNQAAHLYSLVLCEQILPGDRPVSNWLLHESRWVVKRWLIAARAEMKNNFNGIIDDVCKLHQRVHWSAPRDDSPSRREYIYTTKIFISSCAAKRERERGAALAYRLYIHETVDHLILGRVHRGVLGSIDHFRLAPVAMVFPFSSIVTIRTAPRWEQHTPRAASPLFSLIHVCCLRSLRSYCSLLDYASVEESPRPLQSSILHKVS